MAEKPVDQVATLPAEQGSETLEQVATLSASENSNAAIIQQNEETKAVVDGVFIVDGRLALCDSEAEALEIFQACFKSQPIEILPGFRNPQPGEKVLHFRGPDRVPFFGRFE